jgi:DNA (cytosine-5)-methyltransferase 1
VDNTQNIISFCTGYGGIELGLRRAGVDVRTVCNVEIEAFVQANLVAKIEEGRMDNAPIYSDLKTFPAEIFRGKIHGIIGGYPCQPFSSAGKRKGEKDPRHLWPYIREHVRAVRPLWCFFENVRGHTTMGLWRVLSDLEADGYRTEWGLFSAEETGAPHQRIRVFILAYRTDLGLSGAFGIENQESNRGDDASRESTIEGVGESELAHTASREPRQSQARNGGQDIGGGSEEELGDTRSGRFSECEARRLHQPKEKPWTNTLRSNKWPARPGEEQYEWEEPRVTEAQSELGGATHGLTHRVDRLRLLGNGVVPQTAELAWKTLWRKINEQL